MKKFYLSISVICITVVYQAKSQNTRETDVSISVPVQNVYSQNPTPPSSSMLTKVIFQPPNCISPELQKAVNEETNRNKEMLRIQNPSLFQKSTSVPPQFIWPTQPKAGFTDYGYYTVNFLVDHDILFPNHLLDYNCAARTYDFAQGNHAGTDIILWPYPWKNMDDGVEEVVAAADGIIVNRRDGFYDRNCANNGNGNWNGIILEHSDGSRTWYWHFKNGSVTPKNIGDAVVAGEYLGKAGSSGSSDWPHVHFQVMDTTTNYVIDPWNGPCNNIPSMWVNQQPYNVPSVNHICTKYSQLDFYSCGTDEITYEKDTFALGDSLWLWLYTRDMELNSNFHINIYNPSGINVINWDFQVPWATVATSYIRWYYLIDPWWVNGLWTFEALYGGNTYQHQFYINNPTGVPEPGTLNSCIISPNPVTDQIKITLPDNSMIREMQITDELGKKIYDTKIPEIQQNFDCTTLAKGIYIIQAKADKGVFISKFVKE